MFRDCCVALLLDAMGFISMGKRELVALLSLSSWCLVIVVWLFLLITWVFLLFCGFGISLGYAISQIALK